jgi:crossover junction endodeoxyribonuclease RusA
VRRVRQDVATLCRVLHIPPCDAIHVQLIYVPRDRRRRDSDGLVATLKPCLDGIVDAGVVPDDSPEYVTWSAPIIAPADPKDPHLRLEITRK